MAGPKPLFWVASARKDLRAFPEEVKGVVGYALYLAQCGQKHVDAKPLRGFRGAGVLEVVEHHEGNAFRAVYTVKFAGAVYVLHAFQKKSTKGIETPKHEIECVKERLRQAQEHYRKWKKKEQRDG